MEYEDSSLRSNGLEEPLPKDIRLQVGGTPLVSIIPSEFLHHVTEFLMEERGMEREDAEDKMRSRERWVMVIVGGYKHETLVHLGRRDAERWAGYEWKVRAVGWQPLHVLRAFARHSNELNGKEHFVETTFYDTLLDLKAVSQELLRDRGEVVTSSRASRLLNNVIDRYSAGRSIVKESTRQIAQVAMKLSDNVIDSILSQATST